MNCISDFSLLNLKVCSQIRAKKIVLTLWSRTYIYNYVRQQRFRTFLFKYQTEVLPHGQSPSVILSEQ